MATASKIQWTDHTFNPWWGCTKVHTGCKNCYAETLDKRVGGDHWGNSPRRYVKGEWNSPAKWNAVAEKANRIDFVFCASMCDLSEESRDMVDHKGNPIEMETGDLRTRVWEMVEANNSLFWQLLTKRPEAITGMVPAAWVDEPRENVMWVPRLIKVPGYKFLSVEPLVGPAKLKPFLDEIDWVIVGGESGGGSRECQVKWIIDMVDECVEHGTPVFVKQMGESVDSHA